jgi:hypothetical protein
MTSINSLTIGFFQIFTLIGLFACLIILVHALNGIVSKFKRQDPPKIKQPQSAKTLLAVISFVRKTRPIHKAKFLVKIVIALVAKLMRIVKWMISLVWKIADLRTNAKRNLEVRIQNQHALQHAYSKF